MSQSLFILVITFYIVSIVSALIASFLSRFIPVRVINTLIIFHFLVLIFWIMLRDNSHTIANPGNSNYLFLVFFCSGVITGGILLRLSYPVLMKVYFSLYLFSLLLFIIYPSKLLGFAASGKWESIELLKVPVGSYYFVEQQTAKISPGTGKKIFKVIKEMGMFHKTLSRDLVLPATIDSAILATPGNTDTLHARIFYMNDDKRDSMDVAIPVGNHQSRPGELEQRRN